MASKREKFLSWLGPRQVGKTYFSANIRQKYTVLEIKADGYAPCLVVKWESGNVMEFYTNWREGDREVKN